MFSPTPLILGTNYAPTHSQAAQIRLLLAQKEALLARLDLDVARVQAVLAQLLRDSEDTRTFLGAHRALLSPVRRVPLEVMQEIFLHCLPGDQFVRPDAYKAPLLLAQVCVPWRRAVLSTPKLWNSLAMQLSRKNPENRMAFMKLWFSRSSEHPISLFAYIPIANDDSIKAFLGVFASYLHRWKNLRLTLPYRCRLAVLEALNRGMPLLESLHIRFSPMSPGDTPIFQGNLSISNTSTPRLHSLSWGCQGFQPLKFSLHQTLLTDIDVDYPLSVYECLDIMQQCPKLIKCDFKTVTEWGNSSTLSPSSPIFLPQLRSLTIHTNEPLDPFFDHLALPTLQLLKIVDIGRDTNLRIWSQMRFNDFIARSECALQQLHLLNILPSENDLIQCLQWSSSSLVELRVSDIKGVTVVMDNALAVLTARLSSDGKIICICPKLEVIKFGTSLSSSDGMLAGMVESRFKLSSSTNGIFNQQVVPLKSINPRLDPATHSEDLRRLELLREGGLELL